MKDTKWVGQVFKQEKTMIVLVQIRQTIQLSANLPIGAA